MKDASKNSSRTTKTVQECFRLPELQCKDKSGSKKSSQRKCQMQEMQKEGIQADKKEIN